ncbi:MULTISPECIES: LuxR C-terminal-related transcriptional regulator [unclassified Lentimonas]|uniref:LuxR C-terminal-related transcriptional regulator n=1 Tax=unclassified Lentimonas TaxID=2630993 RepID=UPI001389B864|nr:MULTISPECIES: LuxR C-terminal-related transcriptional regulator [unclassified Lentimonas]
MSKVTKARSKRALQLLTLLGEGHAQKEISNILNVSNNTAGTDVRRFYEQLEVQNARAAP